MIELNSPLIKISPLLKEYSFEEISKLLVPTNPNNIYFGALISHYASRELALSETFVKSAIEHFFGDLAPTSYSELVFITKDFIYFNLDNLEDNLGEYLKAPFIFYVYNTLIDLDAEIGELICVNTHESLWYTPVRSDIKGLNHDHFIKTLDNFK